MRQIESDWKLSYLFPGANVGNKVVHWDKVEVLNASAYQDEHRGVLDGVDERWM